MGIHSLAYKTSESVQLDIIDVAHLINLRVASQVSSLLVVVIVVWIIFVFNFFFIMLAEVGVALELVERSERLSLPLFAMSSLTDVYLGMLFDERACYQVELHDILGGRHHEELLDFAEICAFQH